MYQIYKLYNIIIKFARLINSLKEHNSRKLQHHKQSIGQSTLLEGLLIVKVHLSCLLSNISM
jgi:hypothetical protein